MRPTFDERDAAILAARMATFDAIPTPRVGDYVRFACGKLRRISHSWEDWPAAVHGGYQTSDGGSWYLGDGYTSFSGSLFSSVPADTLTLTEEKMPGRVWFFHHNYTEAHNGVDSTPEFRVYACSLPAAAF